VANPDFEKKACLLRLFNNISVNQRPYETEVENKNFIVLPHHVISPRYSMASRFMASVLARQDFKGKSVLDVGTGCGVQGVMAHYAGASAVCGVDINAEAVKNAGINFKRHGLGDDVRASNVFSAIRRGERFDSIIFEAPYYHEYTPLRPIEYAVFDPKYQALKTFFSEASSYLNPGGELIVGFSPYFGDFEVLQTQAKQNGFEETQAYQGTIETHKPKTIWNVSFLINPCLVLERKIKKIKKRRNLSRVKS
jgi:methylase of polypeptide subunit release factors